MIHKKRKNRMSSLVLAILQLSALSQNVLANAHAKANAKTSESFAVKHALARDPFAESTPPVVHKRIAIPQLSWVNLRYADALEMVGWLQHQKGLMQKNCHMGADLSGRRVWIMADNTTKTQLTQLINQLDRPKKQLLVSAKFVRVNNEHVNEQGVHWQFSHTAGHANHSIANHAAPHNKYFVQPLNIQQLKVTPGLANLKIGCLDNEYALDVELKALESNGIGKIIAAPKLLLTDGASASIESGQRIPFQEKVNHDSTATHFEKAVLGLSVTAHVLPDDRIAMTLTIHQDKPMTFHADGAPSISTQVVKTQVSVPNGNIIVLGGIYETVNENSTTKIPLLGDIPILGAIFRHHQMHCERTELLVYIQPRIISQSHLRSLNRR